jgi:hypothetical protein
MDFIKEDQIGAAAAKKLVEELAKVPLIIQVRNADVMIGTTRISGSVDIGIHIGDLAEWAKVVGK